MSKNFVGLYIILGCCGLVLILTGILLPAALEMFSIKVASAKVLYIFQVAFILSGIMDFGLIFYAHKKLS